MNKLINKNNNLENNNLENNNLENNNLENNEFNFTNFYTVLPQHKTIKIIDIDFLTWFIGFFEANGSFEKNGCVNITQKSSDVKLLYQIKTVLGMGKVFKKCSKNETMRWQTNNTNINIAVQIALLFNGNIVTSSKLNSFKIWCEHWMKNEQFKSLIDSDFIIQTKPHPQYISLNNGWLSGFIDGNGYWKISLSIVKNKRNPINNIKMCVFTQNDIEWINNVLTVLKLGRRDGHKNVKWTISKYEEMNQIIKYINSYPHKTMKSVAFTKFCKLRNKILNKKHYGVGYEQMKLLSLEINKFY